MSTSPPPKQNEEGIEDAALVHRSAAASDPQDGETPHGDGAVDKQHYTPDHQEDHQSGKEQQRQKHSSIEDSLPAEDDSKMQGHPAIQEQAQYETEVKEQDRWLPIANGSLKLLPLYSPPSPHSSPPLRIAPSPSVCTTHLCSRAILLSSNLCVSSLCLAGRCSNAVAMGREDVLR